ncbi:MAG: holo-ACP synthase [Selenomonadaceae bacterium]|nr:holo-ACP synthase [Selenomonadaceae bacterium]
MIFGIGTDIIEIERVRRAVSSEHFKEKVFTKLEQNYCESRGAQSAASYAARFAAKEAFFKALGTGIFTSLTEVEILNDAKGKPQIFLHGKAETFTGDKKISVSLSHCKEYATAFVILENVYK